MATKTKPKTRTGGTSTAAKKTTNKITTMKGMPSGGASPKPGSVSKPAGGSKPKGSGGGKTGGGGRCR